MKFTTTILALGLFSVCFGQTQIEEIGSWCTANLQLEANLEEGSQVLYWSKGDVEFGDETTLTIDCATYNYGIYTLFIRDNSGSILTVTHEVAKPAIVVDFKATNYLAAAVTYFEGNAESDEAIISWEWDFGNGETSNVQNPKVMFKEQKIHTVTLTITTESGCKRVITKKHEWAY